MYESHRQEEQSIGKDEKEANTATEQRASWGNRDGGWRSSHSKTLQGLPYPGEEVLSLS